MDNDFLLRVFSMVCSTATANRLGLSIAQSAYVAKLPMVQGSLVVPNNNVAKEASTKHNTGYRTKFCCRHIRISSRNKHCKPPSEGFKLESILTDQESSMVRATPGSLTQQWLQA